MKPLPFGNKITITWFIRLMLALVLATALPLVVSCTGGGDPSSLNTTDPDDDPDFEPPGVPSNIILASTSPSPAVIGISGAGDVESIIITFQIVDVSNEAVTGDHTVNFEILHGGLNGGEKLNNTSAVSAIRIEDTSGEGTEDTSGEGTEDTSGEGTISVAEVKTVFNSGTEAGTVQVRASLASDPSILADVTVTITGGLPSGNAFGLSFGPLNIQGLMTYGLTQDVRTDISDYFSNPVASNMQVNFQTDYSSITGTGTFDDEGDADSGNASVFTATLTTGPPEAEDGFVVIEAQTIGGNHSKVLSIAIHPSDENIIYAGTDGGGIFKTIDGGASWKLVGSPLKDLGAAKFANLTGTIVRDLLIDPNDPEVIYAATDTGIFVSTNAGAVWKNLTGRNRETGDLLDITDGDGYDSDGLSTQCFPFTFDNSGSRARTHVLIDQMATNNYILTSCDIDPTTDEEWVDGIRLFTPWSGRFFSYQLPAGDTVEADYDSRSDASGPFYAVAIDPSINNFDITLGHAKIIYAGSYGYGVWKTSDGGRHWKRMSSMAPDQGVTFSEKVISLAVNTLQPNEIFCGSDGKGLYKSVDGAESWTKVTGTLSFPINETEVRDIVVEPSAGSLSNIWIAGKNGIHYSNNGGSTWLAPETKLSANDPINSDVRAIVRDDNDGTLYAASFGDVLDRSEPHGGVYSSSDGGTNWARVADLGTSTGAHALDSLAVFGKSGNDILVSGSEGRTVFRSTNSGTQWATINGDSPTNITNTLFSSGTVLHSGSVHIELVPIFGSMHGYGNLADNNGYTRSIYNGETAEFFVQVSDENGNRLIAETTIKMSVSAGSGSDIDYSLADGTYGGTDYSFFWTNDLEEEGDVGELSIEVSGEPYGTIKTGVSYLLHGQFSVAPSTIDISLAYDEKSASVVLTSIGGSDDHTFSTFNSRGSVSGKVYTYNAQSLAPGGTDSDVITVEDVNTGDGTYIQVTIAKDEAP